MARNNEKDYDAIIKERSGSFLAYVAKAAEDEMLNEFDQWEKENPNIRVPKNIELKILDLADNFNKLQTREEKRKRARKYVQAAAVVVIAVTAVFTTLTVSVEAVRNRVFDFLFQENTEYMKVIPVETSGDLNGVKSLVPDDWDNYYYPDYLPEGYHFEEAENNGISYMLAFINEEGDVLLFSQQPADEGQMMIDNEGTKKGELTINGSSALWVSKNNYTTLVWSQGSTRFMASGEIELDILLQLAGNLIFIK